MTREQMRAARGLLNWTLIDLAKKAGVHRNTISNIEIGKYAGTTETLTAIRRAFEKTGVEFIDGDRPGVRLRKPKAKGRD